MNCINTCFLNDCINMIYDSLCFTLEFMNPGVRVHTSYLLNPDLLTIIMENQFAWVLSELLLCVCCSHAFDDPSEAPLHVAGIKVSWLLGEHLKGSESDLSKFVFFICNWITRMSPVLLLSLLLSGKSIAASSCFFPSINYILTIYLELLPLKLDIQCTIKLEIITIIITRKII